MATVIGATSFKDAIVGTVGKGIGLEIGRAHV